MLSDPCPTPPGPTADGCLVSGRLSRLQASGNVMVGASRSGRGLVSAVSEPLDRVAGVRGGRGAPVRVAATERASTSPTGARTGTRSTRAGIPRERSVRAEPADCRGRRAPKPGSAHERRPVSLDGAILRVDPATGEGLPDNPLARARTRTRAGSSPTVSETPSGSTCARARTRSGPTSAGIPGRRSTAWWIQVRSCRELRLALLRGPGAAIGYDGANLTSARTSTHRPGAVTGPHFTYNHSSQVVAGEACPTGSSSVAGIDFYQGGPYPASYDGALFFADYSRDCIWAMKADASGIRCPASWSRSSRRPPTPSTCRSHRPASSSTRTSTAARFAASSS